MDCLFCKIANKELDANIRYEDDEVIAFDDITPKTPVHILIIPKKHFNTLNDVDEANELILAKLMRTASHIAKELDIAERGYRVVMNCNSEGGQVVFHIHLHLLGGKPLTWPKP